MTRFLVEWPAAEALLTAITASIIPVAFGILCLFLF
jgi:hypothetical protein